MSKKNLANWILCSKSHQKAESAFLFEFWLTWTYFEQKNVVRLTLWDLSSLRLKGPCCFHLHPWNAALKPPGKEASLAQWKKRGHVDQTKMPQKTASTIGQAHKGDHLVPSNSAILPEHNRWGRSGATRPRKTKPSPKSWEVINYCWLSKPFCNGALFSRKEKKVISFKNKLRTMAFILK